MARRTFSHGPKTSMTFPQRSDPVLRFQYKLRMTHEPVFLEHVSTTSDLQGQFFEFHPEQEGVFCDMEDPVPPLGKDDHLIAVLLDELPPPALPAHRLVPDRRLLRLQAGTPWQVQTSPG